MVPETLAVERTDFHQSCDFTGMEWHVLAPNSLYPKQIKGKEFSRGRSTLDLTSCRAVGEWGSGLSHLRTSGPQLSSEPLSGAGFPWSLPLTLQEQKTECPVSRQDLGTGKGGTGQLRSQPKKLTCKLLPGDLGEGQGADCHDFLSGSTGKKDVLQAVGHLKGT